MRTRRGGLMGFAIVAVLAATAAPVGAFTGYSMPTFFGAAGSGDGQFIDPAGVAVKNSNGDVYVYDAGNRRVEWFNANGSKFEGQLDGSASPTGQFAPPVNVSEHAAHGTLFNLAIDNDPSSPSTGDLYVVDPGHNAIDKFSAAGTYLSQLTGFKAPIFGVAVDTSGNVWVEEEGSEAGENHGPFQEFDNSLTNTHTAEIVGEKLRSPGLALDSEQNLYTFKGEPDVVKFDDKGSLLPEEFTACTCDKALAINSGADELLVDQETKIARFTLLGTPLEEIFGLSASYGIAVNGTSANRDLYATQSEADTVAIFKFGQLPDVTTDPPSEVQRTTAELAGEVNPDGHEVTTCKFEYGTTEAYGGSVPCAQAPGSGSGSVAVSAEVTGLSAQATYHFRLVAGNATGDHAGGNEEFTTPPAVENLLTEEAIAVTGTEATLQGSFEPNGFDTKYQFEYHLVGGPASFSQEEDAGSASEDKHVAAAISGLEPNAIYLFRIIAKNQFGQTIGEYRLLRTEVVAPTIPGNPTASFPTAQSVVLSAELNPGHTTTRFHFEYGACPSLAGCGTVLSTPDETSAAYGTIGATREIVGLAPSTTYAYRLVATNEYEEAGQMREDKVMGQEGTFTTGSAPVPRAKTGSYWALAPTSAIVSGTVYPDGGPAGYVFELGVYNGLNTQYGVVFSGSVPAGATPVEEALQLSGLQPGTTYAYRIAVSSGYIANETHSTQAATVTFTTAGLPSILASPPVLAQLPHPQVAFPKAPSVPKEKHKAAPKKHVKRHKRRHARHSTKGR